MDLTSGTSRRCTVVARRSAVAVLPTALGPSIAMAASSGEARRARHRRAFACNRSWVTRWLESGRGPPAAAPTIPYNPIQGYHLTEIDASTQPFSTIPFIRNESAPAVVVPRILTHRGDVSDRPNAACGEGRFPVGIFRFWTSALAEVSLMGAGRPPVRRACTGAPQKKAGREVRLVLVRVTIRLLLQVEFLSGPRTENSADLGAIHRAFV
jgi:hypothetical protein